MTEPQIAFFDLNGNRLWETGRPARVEILARFGAEDSDATVSFHRREPLPNIQIGDSMEIRLDGSSTDAVILNVMMRSSLTL